MFFKRPIEQTKWISSATYLPFGDVWVESNTGAMDSPELRFPGQWYQAESGLHQNWMRDYDPTTGRYIQADPLGLIDGSSVYGYALQSPMRHTDPRGELACGSACLLALGVGAGLVLDYFLDDDGCFTLGDALFSIASSITPGGKLAMVAKKASKVAKSKKAPDFVVTSDGTAVPVSQSRMRKRFDDAGFPSRPATQTSESGTIHTVKTPRGSVDVQTMDGGAHHPRRAVVNTPGTNSPRTPSGATPQGTKQQRRDRSHFNQRP